MTKFHLRVIIPDQYGEPSNKVFPLYLGRRYCESDDRSSWNDATNQTKLWKRKHTRNGSRRTMPLCFSLTIKLGCSLASGTSRLAELKHNVVALAKALKVLTVPI